MASILPGPALPGSQEVPDHRRGLHGALGEEQVAGAAEHVSKSEVSESAILEILSRRDER
jgi:hypothetical protein